ncbi:MAG: hypothetical protein F4Y16_09170 [Holophagales bacterium]|nr:hypothetical protein [Holophagales bacterium]MYH24282.1 hypothetical protein [Holophagales bacterium]
MAAAVELTFKIGAHTPETMPMDRLVRYLGNLSKVLGHREHVHFLEVRGGSTMPVLRVDEKAYPQVVKRVELVRRGEGPADAVVALDAIEQDLEVDSATDSELSGQLGRLLWFPKTPVEGRRYGPFRQPGTLDGVPVVVGGQQDLVPVHLLASGRVHVCRAKRELAKKISGYLFDTTLRVSGVGNWERSLRGQWIMRRFRIEDYEVLSPKTLGDITEDLQSINGAWKQRPDPLGDLARMREPEDST